MNLKFKVLATQQSKLIKHSSKLRQEYLESASCHLCSPCHGGSHCGLGELDGSVSLENTFQKHEVCISGS